MAIQQSTRAEVRYRGTVARGLSIPFWPPPRGGWIALGSVALLYAAHWFYGALISDTALLMGIVAALLVGGILLSPGLREDVVRQRGLLVPGGLFALVIAVALWTLTPYVPGGPHPVWAYVGASPGASTIDRSATTMEILKLLGLACLFVVGLACGARDDRARYAVRLTLAAGAIFGLWAFIGSVTGAIYQSGGRRLEAHFLNPNTAGTFFAALLILAASELARAERLQTERRDLTRLTWPGLAVLIFAVCLLDTASRGAALSFCAAGLVYIALQLWSGRLKPTRAVIGFGTSALILAGLVSFAGERLLDRAFQSHEASVVRASVWQIHWRAFLDSPLLGYGLGTSPTVNRTLLDGSNFDVLWNIRAILNVYLEWLEEAGLIGAIPMFLCVAAIVMLVGRGYFRRNRATDLLAGLLAADAVFILHGATDFGLQVPSVAALWAWLLGLQTALAQGSSQR